jgi:hypothetical protein
MPEFQTQQDRGAQEIQETTLSWRNALIATLLTTLEKWADLYVQCLDHADSIEATKKEFNLFLKDLTLLFMISKKLMPEKLQNRVLSYLDTVNPKTPQSREDGMALVIEIQHHLEEKGIVPLILNLPEPAFILEAMNERANVADPVQHSPIENL